MTDPLPPLNLEKAVGGDRGDRDRGDRGDKVGALFARIKADRASVLAKASSPPAPSPPPEAAVEDASVETATPEPATEDAPEAPPEPTPPQDTAPAGEPAVSAPAAPVPGDLPGPAREHEARHVADESARSRRDELLEPIEETLVRQLKRALQDEQNEVLDSLRRKRRREPAPVLPSPEQQAARYRAAALPALTEAAKAGARFASPSGDQSPPDAAIAPEVAAVLVDEIVRPLRERLEGSVERGADDAGDRDDEPQLAESLSAVYRQWRSQEMEPRARHQAIVAFARGALSAYPDGAELRWVVDDDGLCPDCDDNELAGAVPKGDAYPTGQLHPPAHPGCRCLLVLAVP